MPKIVITRKNEWINRLKYYTVLINDKQVGSIKSGSSEELTVAAGQLQIECKVNWYYSNNYVVDAKEGETVYLQVKNNSSVMLIMLLIAIITFFTARILQLKGVIDMATMHGLRIGYVALLAIYFIYQFTIGRRKYLWLGPDESNPFAN